MLPSDTAPLGEPGEARRGLQAFRGHPCPDLGIFAWANDIAINPPLLIELASISRTVNIMSIEGVSLEVPQFAPLASCRIRLSK